MVGRSMSENTEPQASEPQNRQSEIAVEEFERFPRGYVQSRLPGGLRRHVGTSESVQNVLCVATREYARFRGSNELQYRGWWKRIAHHKMIDKVLRYQLEGSSR